MTRIALGLAYDGSGWHGWQSQPHRRTIQDTLEAALSRFADRPVRVACAGRTDTGVHALGQVVHFDCDARRTLAGWVRGVNALLPPSIAVTWSVASETPAAATPRGRDAGRDTGRDAGIEAGIDAGNATGIDTGIATGIDTGIATGVDSASPTGIDAGRDGGIDPRFDARFDATARTYHYLLLVQPQRAPHWTGRAGWTHTPLDVDAMRRACVALIGTHDFSAFRSAECQAKSPVKTMALAAIATSGGFVRFTFRADAFLHHMVRNLVGTLVAIGRGREPPTWMAALVAGRDRTVAAPTFMPDGLYLARVDYRAPIALPPPVAFAHIHAGFAAADA